MTGETITTAVALGALPVGTVLRRPDIDGEPMTWVKDGLDPTHPWRNTHHGDAHPVSSWLLAHRKVPFTVLWRPSDAPVGGGDWGDPESPTQAHPSPDGPGDCFETCQGHDTLPPGAVEAAARAIDPAPWRSEHPASRARREDIRATASAALTAALPHLAQRELHMKITTPDGIPLSALPALADRLDAWAAEHRIDARAVLALLATQPTRPEIVTICGSTRFRAEMAEANRDLTLAGAIVLAPGVFGHSGDAMTDEQKSTLDDLHLRKIDLSDRVVVVAPGGYVGDSTSREAAYAKERGKLVEVRTEFSAATPAGAHISAITGGEGS